MSVGIKVDVSDLATLAADLSNAADVINVGASRAVNALAAEVRKETAARITSQINLKLSYVDPKLVVSQNATPEKLTATIEAPQEGVLLSRFGAAQQSQANVWTAATYAAKFGSLNANVRPSAKAPKMPWTPRTGDRSFGRGIAPGAKSAGIKVAVLAGSAQKAITYAFLLPLKAGKSQGGNGVGVFKHIKGTKKVKSLKGLSVDQMARIAWTKGADEISNSLSEKVLEAVTADIQKELNK